MGVQVYTQGGGHVGRSGLHHPHCGPQDSCRLQTAFIKVLQVFSSLHVYLPPNAVSPRSTSPLEWTPGPTPHGLPSLSSFHRWLFSPLQEAAGLGAQNLLCSPLLKLRLSPRTLNSWPALPRRSSVRYLISAPQNCLPSHLLQSQQMAALLSRTPEPLWTPLFCLFLV